MNAAPRMSASVAALGAALAAGCSPALDWRELRPEGGAGLTVQMPCKASSHARMLALAGAPVRTTLYACSTADVTWGVAIADVQDPARVGPALGELKAAAAGNLAAGPPRPLAGVVAGATPNPQAGRIALDGHYPGGRTAQMQVAVFARGTWVVQATVLGERLDTDAADNFFASLRIAR